MNQDFIILLLFIAFIAGLFLWAWRLHAQDKKQASKIVGRVAIAIALAIPFFIISVFIIIVALWSGRGQPRDFNAIGRPFTIVNNTSVPLRASASIAYTPYELEELRGRGIDIDLTANFVTYPETLIPCEGKDFERQHDFTIPIPRYQQQPVEWPSEMRITLTDSLGDRVAWFCRDDIDSTMRARMRIVVTDSMLHPIPKVMIEELPKRQYKWKGDGR